MHQCRVCGCSLVIGENWIQSRADRNQRICRPCANRKAADWQANNPEKTKAHRSATARRRWADPDRREKAKAATKRWEQANPEKVRACRSNWRHNNPEARMVQKARSRAKAMGLPCSITKHDIAIPDLCPILGIPLFENKGGGHSGPNSPSLDKIIPSLGYVPGNVQVISHRANTAKNDLSPEELLRLASWVLSHLGDRPQ